MDLVALASQSSAISVKRRESDSQTKFVRHLYTLDGHPVPMTAQQSEIFRQLCELEVTCAGNRLLSSFEIERAAANNSAHEFLQRRLEDWEDARIGAVKAEDLTLFGLSEASFSEAYFFWGKDRSKEPEVVVYYVDEEIEYKCLFDFLFGRVK